MDIENKGPGGTIEPLEYANEYYNNTKLFFLFLEKMDEINHMTPEKEVKFHVRVIGTAKDPEKVYTELGLSVMDDTVLLNHDITALDSVVMNAVYTLYVYGYQSFTTRQIANVINGTRDRTVSPEKEAEIDGCMKALAGIRITIDCSAEFERRKVKGTARYTDYLLPIKELEVTAPNGRRIYAYHLIEKPVLFEYAERLHQITSVPASLIGEKKRIRDRTDVAIVRQGLIQRIAAVGSNKSYLSSTTILYDNFFRKLGYRIGTDANGRNKKSDLHRIVLAIMDQLVDNGFIASYTVLRKGRSIIGVRFALPEQKAKP